MTTVIIYEDEGYRKFLPLVYSRPVFDLRCGVHTIREKVISEYEPEKLILFCRDYLKEHLLKSNDVIFVNQCEEDRALLINGRVLPNGLKEKVPADGPDCVYKCGEEIAAVRVSGDNLKKMLKTLADGKLENIDGIPSEEISADIIKWPWNLVHKNAAQIESDIALMNRNGEINGTVYDDVQLLNRSGIIIEEGAKVYPYVVLDAEEGPIYIGKDVKIMPHSVIAGPVSIGDRCLVKPGSHIYDGASFGEFCKIAGEVEGSIIHSYSNKQHYGFLGHSYLGQWVNLGAGTPTSDLKNNYRNVRVTINMEIYDTGTLFCGCFVGVHSKTSINVTLNTGTVVGFSCNIFGEGFLPKYIPSFTWGGSKGFSPFDLKKSTQLAETVMGRRKIAFTKEEEMVFEEVYNMTKPERNVFMQNHPV